MSKNPAKSVRSGAVPARAGVLVYHVAWKDATGNFDVWPAMIRRQRQFGVIAGGFGPAF